MKARVTGLILCFMMALLVEDSWGFTESSGNNFFGSAAGASNTTGYGNSFFGSGAGELNDTGGSNSFFGYMAGHSNTTGGSNLFVGNYAGERNTTGHSNVFVGYQSGGWNTVGYENTLVGFGAGFNNRANYNSFFGSLAGSNNNTGTYNTFVGRGAGSYNITAGYNTFVGDQAGNLNNGEANTFIGASAGRANTTGYSNVFLGIYSGLSNTTGTVNTFIGTNAGYLNKTGWYNVFLGTETGNKNDSGNRNVSLGYQAGYNNVTGSRNVFIGDTAGWSETGSNKLYIDNGLNASPLVYGDFSTAILTVNGKLGVGKSPTTALDVNGTVTATGFTGNGAGLTNVVAATVANGVYATGSYANPDWIISLAGAKITGTVANSTNASNASSCAHTVEIGPISTNYIPRWNGIQMLTGIISDDGISAAVNGKLTVASVASASDERYKRNIKPLQLSLDKLTHLTGVSYDWKTEEYKGKGFTEGRQIGLIAQEVEKVLPELVVADDKGYRAISYDKLVPVLIEAVKEQQASIMQKDSRIKKLEKALEMMEQRLASLENLPQKLALK